MKKGIIEINPERCLACKSCEIACAVAHSGTKNLELSIKEIPLPEKRVQVEQADVMSKSGQGFFLKMAAPLQCRHCEDAPCVKICPTKALTKTHQEEPVLLDNKLCIGCKWCILVCPFGVIKMDRTGGAIIKCDLCIERLKQNELPACVVSCPTKAIKFRTLEETAKEKRKKFLVDIASEKNT
ncbi:MAG: 4Fe-4S binding protein [Elusimicrobia bacterium]|nr:4Fe-4S binding protein [Elusimicrobiota bacterium]